MSTIAAGTRVQLIAERQAQLPQLAGATGTVQSTYQDLEGKVYNKAPYAAVVFDHLSPTDVRHFRLDSLEVSA